MVLLSRRSPRANRPCYRHEDRGSGLRAWSSRSLRLLWCYSTTVCWRWSCPPSANRPRWRKGWTKDWQILHPPSIRTCKQKAIRIYWSQHKVRHRRVCAIWVRESVTYTSFSKESSRKLLKSFMKKIHTPNHKLYEQYYLDQAKQKDGNLSAFRGARFELGYGLGSIFRGLSR